MVVVILRGFTAKTSPINVAVVTTEGINEAKDNSKTVSITTLKVMFSL
jgi:hypothetical protein